MRPQRGKQKLFDSAMKLFETQGYFATSVEQITAEAGVSKGLVYNYFRSKEELLVGLIEHSTERMASVAAGLANGESAEESLSAFLNEYFRLLQDERQFLRLQLTLLLMPELQETVAEPQRQRASMLLEVVTRWLRQAKVLHAKRKARLLLATLDGMALHYLCVYHQYPLASMKPDLMQMVRNLCASPTEEAP